MTYDDVRSIANVCIRPGSCNFSIYLRPVKTIATQLEKRECVELRCLHQVLHAAEGV